MILSSLSPDETKNAIVSGDVNTLKSVKGIGQKSAERVIVDLKDKISGIEVSSSNFAVSNNTIKEEALSALMMLGFAKKPAEKALEKALLAEEDLTVEELIKRTLKNL